MLGVLLLFALCGLGLTFSGFGERGFDRFALGFGRGFGSLKNEPICFLFWLRLLLLGCWRLLFFVLAAGGW